MGRRRPQSELVDEVQEAVNRELDMTPDTVSLEEACARAGISYSMGKRLAQAGHPLTEGVRILRFGAPSSDRPVYRVSKAALHRAFDLDEVAAS